MTGVSVDGRNVGTDGTKLDTIEDNAKDDQSAAEVPFDNTISGLTATNVKVAIDEVDGRLDTTETKLATIEVDAKDDQTGAEIKSLLFAEADTNNLTDILIAKLNDMVNAKVQNPYTTTGVFSSDGTIDIGVSPVNGSELGLSMWVVNTSGNPGDYAYTMDYVSGSTFKMVADDWTDAVANDSAEGKKAYIAVSLQVSKV